MFAGKDNERTEIKSLGEFGLIDRLTSGFKTKHSSTILGIGDDAAIIHPSENEHLVVTTDMLVEGVHFDLSWMPLKHLGYKSVAVNLSDIAAMNAEARQITVSIAISNRFSVEALDELYQGMQLACERYGADLVGGDTTSSPSGLVISISAIGTTKPELVTRRSGAKVTDLICVSGDLGGAYAGLLLLQREKRTFMANPAFQPDLEGNDYILERQLKPEPRFDITKQLAASSILPTSMIDISDGLASELHHICKQSGCGCTIYEDKIPLDVQTINTAEEFNLDPLTLALSGGEDYELLFTVPLADFEKLRDIEGIAVIGHIEEKEEGLHLVNNIGQKISLKALGWDSFNQ